MDFKKDKNIRLIKLSDNKSTNLRNSIISNS
jgi:hypothetical protein